MLRPAIRAFVLLASVAGLCGSLDAQTGKTISIRMLDGKTGRLIAPSNFLVRIDHQEAVHGDWLRQNDDGTAEVTVPDGASWLSVQATYNLSMEMYVNCDAGMENNTEKVHWYSIPEILKAGVAAPNKCNKGRDAAKSGVAAKPGEFVFFARKRNWRESSQD
jgi:hypothetical protein